MSNKRVTELALILPSELSSEDLFLLADVAPNPESKKLQLFDLKNYILSNGNLSGSLTGTSSWAQNAVSTSYAPPQTSGSYAATSSWSWNSISASIALLAISASYALSSSYSLTASYALSSSCNNCSSSISSAFSTYAYSASFLIYTGIPNGTASFAMTASHALSLASSSTSSFAGSCSFASSSNFAQSASHLIYDGTPNGTAYYAINATNATSASNAQTASVAYVALTASVGITTNFQSSASFASRSISSSHALIADTAYLANTASFAWPSPYYIRHGVYSAITHSLSSSVLDLVAISSSQSTSSSFEAVGTVVVPWTASQRISESITLNLLNRTTGYNRVLDRLPIYIFNGGASAASGSIKMPVSLMGNAVVPADDYLLSISASTTGIQFDLYRYGKFSVDVNIGSFTVAPAPPLAFYTDNLDNLTFSSSAGGPFQDTYPNIVNVTGSPEITLMDFSAITGRAHKVWTLVNCTTVQARGNTGLTGVGGMPAALLTMSIVTSSITRLEDLSATSITRLVCTKGLMTTMPTLRDTMSYINVSQNPLTTFGTVPYGMKELYCDGTNLTNPPTTLTPSIVSMSFSNNSGFTTWLSTLPTSLAYFWCRNNPSMTTLPTIPAPMIYLDVSNNDLTDTVQDNICADLVSNGLNSGSLDLRGNQTLLALTLTRITTLLSRAWSVQYV